MWLVLHHDVGVMTILGSTLVYIENGLNEATGQRFYN